MKLRLARSSRSSCQRHGMALFDLIDGNVAGAGTDAALEHIATCDRCREEAADAALLVVWLGRLAETDRSVAGDGAGGADRSASGRRAWTRIRARLERRGGPATVGRMAGLLTVPLLVLALAGPRLLASPGCDARAGGLLGGDMAECQDGLPAPTLAAPAPARPTEAPATLLIDVSGATLVAPGERTLSRVAREPDDVTAARPAVTGLPPRGAAPSRSVPRAGVAFPI